MAQFAPALEYTLNFEDARRTYAATADNNGGGVIAGINEKAFPTQYKQIVSLPVDQRPQPVSVFYKFVFWDTMHLGGLDSQDLANRVFDMGVNGGMVTSGKILQDAINAIPTAKHVAVDGIIGEGTLASANACEPEAILASFRTQRLAHYAECKGSTQLHKVWAARASA